MWDWLRPRPRSSPPPSVSATRGGIAAGGNINNVQLGLDEREVERRHREQMDGQERILQAIAREKGVEEAPLRAVLAKLGQIGAPLAEIPGRLNEAADELLRLRADLARLRNDRPEFAAIRARASAFLDKGEFDLARAELRKGREAARELRKEYALAEAGFLLDEARIEKLQLHYDDACAKLEEAATLNPDDPWIAIELGDLWTLRGSLDRAKQAYLAAEQAARRSGDPRDLSVSLEKIGDVLVDQGNLPEALKSFRDGLDIRDALAKADPGNAGWRRDLYVSYIKIGDVLVAQGNLPEALKSFREGLDIAVALAKADPGNAGWRRDLSVSFNKIGGVLVAQGNLPEALKSFRDGLEIAVALAKADPGNAEWRRDLSVSLEKIGDVLVAQGNLSDALIRFRDSLDIRDALAKADPGNAEWRRDLIVSCVKMATVEPAQASAYLSRALQIAAEMQDRGQLAPRDAWMVAELSRRLAAADPAGRAER